LYLSKNVITIGGSSSIGAGRIILVSAVSFNALQHTQSTTETAQNIISHHCSNLSPLII